MRSIIPIWKVLQASRERAHFSHIDLTNALYKIPEAVRVPLVLKHVEGFSYEEIALTMKIGLSAAKMRVKRGRAQLVKYLSA